MTESRVAFLYKAAAALNESKNEKINILKSYYLMRCKEITKGYGLPNRHFSPQVRCPSCCLEWKSNSHVKVKSIKLSSRQRKRLKSKKNNASRKQNVKCASNLINCNELEQVCSFCSKKMSSFISKPIKELPNTTGTLCEMISKENPIQVNHKSDDSKTSHVLYKQSKNSNLSKQSKSVSTLHNINSKEKNNQNKKMKRVNDAKKKSANVYANALDVFSMKNKNNILQCAIKEKPKVIKNNKKKKVKFAGLCEKAVLAAAKLKEQKKKQNSLNLFLKPSQ